MREQLFATKPLAKLLEEVKGENRLKRVLGPVGLTSLGVGAIIGTGIFVLTGVAAAEKAGPAMSLSMVAAGMTCIFAALCYAEFAAMVPVAGSAYTYAYATLGELFAWIIGWDLVLEYAVGASTVAHGWSHYFQDLLKFFNGGKPLWPAIFANSPFDYLDEQIRLDQFVRRSPGDRDRCDRHLHSGQWDQGERELQCGDGDRQAGGRLFRDRRRGVLRQSRRTGSRSHPTDTAGSAFSACPSGARCTTGTSSGMLAGAATIFFAYIGFDAVSTQSEEARNPQRDVPIGIIASLIICTFLYIAVAAVLTGMVPYNKINIDAPVSDAFAQVGLPWAQFLIAVGAITGITSVLLVMMLSQPRVLLAMARDGLVPPAFFGAIHPRFRTPWKSTILTGVFVATLAALLPLNILAELVNIGTLLAFLMVCAAVLIMRKTQSRCPPAVQGAVHAGHAHSRDRRPASCSCSRCPPRTGCDW